MMCVGVTRVATRSSNCLRRFARGSSVAQSNSRLRRVRRKQAHLRRNDTERQITTVLCFRILDSLQVPCLSIFFVFLVSSPKPLILPLSRIFYVVLCMMFFYCLR